MKIGLILVSGLLYSLSITCVGVASRFMPPLTLTTWRLVTASVVFALALALVRPGFRRDPGSLADLFVLGLVNICLPFLCLAVAVRYISGALAALLFNTTPLFTVAFAHLVLPEERLNAMKLGSLLVALLGATLLLASNASGLAVAHSHGWIGQLLILAASAASALAVVYARIRLVAEQSVIVAAGQIFTALLVILPLALVVDGPAALAGPYPWPAWAAMMAGAVVGPVIAFWLLFTIVRRYSASLAGFAGIATPFFSALLGSLFLGEVLTAPMAMGMGFILVSVWSLHRS